MEMKIGFARREITPPAGTELGGYAGYRPCAGVHDPLWCKAVVLEQNGDRYALLAMDLLSVDESLSEAISRNLAPMGIRHAVVAAIHSHATPCGIVLGEGPLAEVNRVAETDPAGFRAYTEHVIAEATDACREAVSNLERFDIRSARGPAPVIGSERHTGEKAELTMTVVQIRTESGRSLLVYQLPCHPTVLGPENLLASADFVGGIEERLDADMAVFLNGAAGDISTRFTRREQTFAECDRLAALAANAVKALIWDVPYRQPTELKGLHTHIALQPRPVEPEEAARKAFENEMARWQQAKESGEEPGKLRILKSYVEGAGVALEFAKTMAGIRQLRLPVTVVAFAGLMFATVPGEMFSNLWNLDAVPICYANGYYRYIGDTHAYDAGYYEAMAAILARGQGEEFRKQTAQLLEKI
jgi:hypothetical protein